MAHLSELRFKNFQSLKDTGFELDPGFNVIVGPSNLGKSAALRAIKALARNAPAPGLVREGAKEFELTASFSDGTVVRLTKGKNKSVFTLNDKDYPKSGVKAPDEVTEYWSLAAPDGRELSFASQHDAPFLLDEPASAVAKVLGDLTNANLLMEAVQKANKMRTDALNDSKARLREAEEAREQILSHAGLSVRIKAVDNAREAFKEAEQSALDLAELDLLVSRHDLITEDQERVEIFLANAADVSDQVVAVERDLIELNKLELLVSTRDKLHQALSDVGDQQRGAERLRDEAENEIHQLLDDAGVCPLCGQETK